MLKTYFLESPVNTTKAIAKQKVYHIITAQGNLTTVDEKSQLHSFNEMSCVCVYVIIVASRNILF
jgi:hypothetical protein